MLCHGCGARIQTAKPGEIGYAPTSTLEKDPILCQRCFRLKHYNEIQDVSMNDDDFLTMVSKIRDTSSLAIHIIDVFDIDGSLIKSLPRIVGGNPILLVGNKADLLPKSTNKDRLIQWLRKTAKEAGIQVADVHLISAKKGHGISELKQAIERYRDNKDVYIVGTTNAGKSTFINRLINESTGEKNVITTSFFPGTTLGFIEIPLDDKTALIDTPGIVNKQQMAHYVSKRDLKLITPDQEVKPRIYQLNSEQTLFFGGLARIDFIKGKKQSFVCYFSNQLPIHRTKLDNADKLYNEHKGKLLSPPDSGTIEMLPAQTASHYKISDEKTDIVFPGLGWVTLFGNLTVAAHSPKGVNVSLRKSFI